MDATNSAKVDWHIDYYRRHQATIRYSADQCIDLIESLIAEREELRRMLRETEELLVGGIK